MRIITLVLIGFILFVAIGIGLLRLFNREVFRTPAFESCQLLFSAIALPKDFGTPVLVQNLDLSKGDGRSEYKFRIQYVGDKKISVVTDKTPGLMDKTFGGAGYTPGFKLKLKIYQGEKMLWESETEKYLTPYFNNNEIGFSVGEFNCPSNVPLDSEMKLEVEVIQHDLEFEKTIHARVVITNRMKE